MQFSKIGSRADGNFADKVGAPADKKLIQIDAGTITFQFSVADPTDAIKLMDDMIAQADSARAGLSTIRTVLRALSAISLTLLMRLMHAHVSVMLTLLKSLLTSLSRTSHSAGCPLLC